MTGQPDHNLRDTMIDRLDLMTLIASPHVELFANLVKYVPQDSAVLDPLLALAEAITYQHGGPPPQGTRAQLVHTPAPTPMMLSAPPQPELQHRPSGEAGPAPTPQETPAPEAPGRRRSRAKLSLEEKVIDLRMRGEDATEIARRLDIDAA